MEQSECIQIAKSCGCTQVSLLEGNTIDFRCEETEGWKVDETSLGYLFQTLYLIVRRRPMKGSEKTKPTMKKLSLRIQGLVVQSI